MKNIEQKLGEYRKVTNNLENRQKIINTTK